MRLGKGMWISGHPFERSDHLLACSSVTKSILNIIQKDLSSTPLFHDALYLPEREHPLISLNMPPFKS